MDNPMFSLITEALDFVVGNLCNPFVRKDVMVKTSMTRKLLKVDFTEKANKVPQNLLILVLLPNTTVNYFRISCEIMRKSFH